MALVDPTCFLGLSPAEREQQIYEALYVQISDPTGFVNPNCFSGLSPELKIQALYAALYSLVP